MRYEKYLLTSNNHGFKSVSKSTSIPNNSYELYREPKLALDNCVIERSPLITVLIMRSIRRCHKFLTSTLSSLSK